VITVDPAQMPPFLKGAWSNTDVAAALEWASSAVEAYCERDFTYRANETVLVDPFPVKRSAQLPNPPVIAVTAVEGWLRNDQGVLAWVPLTNYAWTKDGLLYDTSGQPGTDISQLPTWPTLPKSLKVTYTHGFVDMPDAVVSAVIKAAAGYLANPFNMSERRTGEISYKWDARAEALLDDTLLGAYRLITVPR
jgi:hypothetical protein